MRALPIILVAAALATACEFHFSYRSDLKLTTIRFEKTNFLCELSR